MRQPTPRIHKGLRNSLFLSYSLLIVGLLTLSLNKLDRDSVRYWQDSSSKIVDWPPIQSSAIADTKDLSSNENLDVEPTSQLDVAKLKFKKVRLQLTDYTDTWAPDSLIRVGEKLVHQSETSLVQMNLDGQVEWYFQPDLRTNRQSLRLQPLGFKNHLFASFANKRIYALDPKNGRLRWSKFIPTLLATVPLTSKANTLLATAFNHSVTTVWVLNPTTGETLRRIDIKNTSRPTSIVPRFVSDKPPAINLAGVLFENGERAVFDIETGSVLDAEIPFEAPPAQKAANAPSGWDPSGNIIFFDESVILPSKEFQTVWKATKEGR